MIRLEELCETRRLVLDLTEEDIVELYTIVAIFGKSKLAYQIGSLFEEEGFNFDTSLLDNPNVEVYFKTQRK